MRIKNELHDEMISIKDMTMKELREHLTVNSELLDDCKSGTGEWDAAFSEYQAAKKELQRRKRTQER